MRRRTLTSNDAYSVGYILSFLAQVANVYFPPKHIYFPVCYLAWPVQKPSMARFPDWQALRVHIPVIRRGFWGNFHLESYIGYSRVSLSSIRIT